MKLIKLKVVWYYIEILYSKILRLLHIKRDTSVIPKGMYCYVIDRERNIKEPFDGYWIKKCKYYRSLEGELCAGCTYVGVIGWDLLLGDQCKICDVNDDID
jgi:hypothetical protein